MLSGTTHQLYNTILEYLVLEHTYHSHRRQKMDILSTCFEKNDGFWYVFHIHCSFLYYGGGLLTIYRDGFVNSIHLSNKFRFKMSRENLLITGLSTFGFCCTKSGCCVCLVSSIQFLLPLSKTVVVLGYPPCCLSGDYWVLIFVDEWWWRLYDGAEFGLQVLLERWIRSAVWQSEDRLIFIMKTNFVLCRR